MPIKHPEILTRADFDESIVRLRLNASEIAKETGIPRTYLSEFRNGDRKLRPEHLAKLRDYFEEKGIEFEPESATESPSGHSPTSPHPQLRGVETVRYFFPIDESVPREAVKRAMAIMEENDARLVLMIEDEATRNSGIFGDGDFSDETKAALQQAFGLLAENYVLFRMLRGWHALSLTSMEEGVETLRDVLAKTFKPLLEKAKLIEPSAENAKAFA